MERRAGSSEGQVARSWPEDPSFRSACGSSRPFGGCFDLASSPLGDTSLPALSSGLPEDSLLLSPKRACLNGSSSAKAQTSSHLLPSPHNLLKGCFGGGHGGGDPPLFQPPGSTSVRKCPGPLEKAVNPTKFQPLCSGYSLMSFSHQPWRERFNFYRGPS